MMNILHLTRPPADPSDPEALRRGLEGLKSTKLRDAEAALAAARAERATAAEALRSATAAMQRRRDSSSETTVSRLSAELDAIDERVGKGRLVRNEARKPLADALRKALAPYYGEAAHLLRDAEAVLQVARRILTTAEDFAGRNGIDLTSFASRLPSSLDTVAEQLEARS